MSKKDISYPEEGHENCFQIEDQSFWFQARNRLIRLQVSKYLHDKESFFDIGGGNGFVSKMLQDDLSLEVTLVEPGKKGCENAKERGIKNIINSDFELLNRPLTNVGLFDVVEHLEDDKGFLERISAKQIEGSYTFITVPSYRFLWSDEDDLAGHFSRYTPFNLKQKLEESGFEVVSIIPFFFFLIFPILAFRAVPFRLGLRSGSSLNSDHVQNGLLSRMINFLLGIEFYLIKSGLKFPYGASLFVIARKLAR